jgi:predicted nucleic acid-binding protein
VAYLKNRPRLVTSRLATVEVARAVKVANAAPAVGAAAVRLLEGCVLIEVDAAVLARAAELSSVDLRALGAIHVATAESVEPDRVLAYDRRVLRAVEAAGLATASPGT